MYNLSETIVFFLALTNPRDRVQLEDISKKKKSWKKPILKAILMKQK